jgi:hypothetical protein
VARDRQHSQASLVRPRTRTKARKKSAASRAHRRFPATRAAHSLRPAANNTNAIMSFRGGGPKPSLFEFSQQRAHLFREVDALAPAAGRRLTQPGPPALAAPTTGGGAGARRNKWGASSSAGPPAHVPKRARKAAAAAASGEAVFDPRAHADYVSGFRKRKQQRRREALRQLERQTREARVRGRAERRTALKAELGLPEDYGLGGDEAGAVGGAKGRRKEEEQQKKRRRRDDEEEEEEEDEDEAGGGASSSQEEEEEGEEEEDADVRVYHSRDGVRTTVSVIDLDPDSDVLEEEDDDDDDDEEEEEAVVGRAGGAAAGNGAGRGAAPEDDGEGGGKQLSKKHTPVNPLFAKRTAALQRALGLPSKKGAAAGGSGGASGGGKKRRGGGGGPKPKASKRTRKHLKKTSGKKKAAKKK